MRWTTRVRGGAGVPGSRGHGWAVAQACGGHMHEEAGRLFGAAPLPWPASPPQFMVSASPFGSAGCRACTSLYPTLSPALNPRAPPPPPPPPGDFGDTAVQGALVHQLRYLASVVTQNFSAFGELLALPKRFAEISGAGG